MHRVLLKNTKGKPVTWESEEEVLKEAAPSPGSRLERNKSQKRRRKKVLPGRKKRIWSGTELWKCLLQENLNILLWAGRDEGRGRSWLWRSARMRTRGGTGIRDLMDIWVWVNSESWWWTGRPGMLRFMGSQRVGHDWTELKGFHDGEHQPHLCLRKIIPGATGTRSKTRRHELEGHSWSNPNVTLLRGQTKCQPQGLQEKNEFSRNDHCEIYKNR